MAITKLMHMKEGIRCSYDHLKNAIDYILDVKHEGEKTQNGVLVGGNSGTTHNEILESFLETKRRFGKLDGRQGYHFVISFAKGEADEMMAYDVAKEFCEEYLGDNYDYVFAIHNDKGHKHGHIVFNSVSRMDGYKYHYKKGDWEKYIQPITDKISVAHGLTPLTFEKERVGVSYASWAAEHEGKFNWRSIMRADADYAIQQAGSFEEFQNIMQKMNYQLRSGYSKKYNSQYIAFTFVEPDGKKHSWRSYKMPAGYSPEEITQRIRSKEGSRYFEKIEKKLSGKANEYLKSTVLKSTQTYKRLYQAVNYYKLPNPFAVPAYQVRKDIIQIDRLLEECQYIKENNVRGKSELEKREKVLDEKLRKLQTGQKTLYGMLEQIGEEQLVLIRRYNELKQKLEMIGLAEKDYEEVEDRMEKIEAALPHGMLHAKNNLEKCKKEIANIRKEKRLIERILKTETDQELGVVIQPIRR